MTGALLLAFDCSAAACSAAVARDGEILAARFEERPRGQGERLLPMLADVLDEAGCRYADLAALAVTLGPGSFTGLRIGLATARALALAAGLPIIGRTAFEVVAADAAAERAPGEALAVAIDSQRGDLFLQAFPDGGESLSPRAGAPGSLAESLAGSLPGSLPRSPAEARGGDPGPPWLLAGSGAGRLAEALAARGRSARLSSVRLPDAAALARLAACDPLPPPGSPAPSAFYMRPPDTTGPITTGPDTTGLDTPKPDATGSGRRG